MGLNHDYLDKRFGFHTIPEFPPKIVVVTTSVKLVVPQHADRLLLFIQNIGSNVAYILDDETVTSDKGLYLDKNGGFWELPIEWYGEFITHEFFVKGAGSSNLYIVSMVGTHPVGE